MRTKLTLLLCALSLTACKVSEVKYQGPPNILLIIADDMGKDATNGFSEGTIKPKTPHIDRIKDSGLSFHNFWTYATCSPTRASIITGKYGYRTGVNRVHQLMKPTETILQKYIKDNSSIDYATAVVGKWHLAGKTNNTFNPENLGMDYYAGLIGGTVTDYNAWQLTQGGKVSLQTSYITRAFTDLAINWVNAQEKPWFLWLAYSAPHTPIHLPPSEMHSQGELPPYEKGMDIMPYHTAMIESLDYEIGRFLDSIPQNELANTLIIFIGDNGTYAPAAQAPYSSDKAKGTLYQGGINNPMFVSGPGVLRRGIDHNLVTSTDLFATIAEIAGVAAKDTHDSKSFRHLFTDNRKHRNFQYCEMNDGTEKMWVISNGRYKLFIHADGKEEFYHLAEDPYEGNDLIGKTMTKKQLAAKNELVEELGRIRN